MADERPSSAMGPSDEPGEANPAPADKALGLGSTGTEGKAGPEEGGTEPQLPTDIHEPTPEEIKRIVENVEQMPPGTGSPASEQRKRRRA